MDLKLELGLELEWFKKLDASTIEEVELEELKLEQGQELGLRLIFIYGVRDLRCRAQRSASHGRALEPSTGPSVVVCVPLQIPGWPCSYRGNRV